MESEKSNRTQSGSVDVYSQVELRGTGPDKYETTKLVANIENAVSSNLISSMGVQKEKFCTDCAEENQQTSMRVLKEKESKSRKNIVGPRDLVWGKVMAHPWWPAQIYDESLALSPLGHTKRDGSIPVPFFW